MTAWIDPWRDATVAIGHVHELPVSRPGAKRKRKKVFVVFHDPSEDWTPPNLQIRFSWFDEKPVDEYLGIRLWGADPEPGLVGEARAGFYT